MYLNSLLYRRCFALKPSQIVFYGENNEDDDNNHPVRFCNRTMLSLGSSSSFVFILVK